MSLTVLCLPAHTEFHRQRPKLSFQISFAAVSFISVYIYLQNHSFAAFYFYFVSFMFSHFSLSESKLFLHLSLWTIENYFFWIVSFFFLFFFHFFLTKLISTLRQRGLLTLLAILLGILHSFICFGIELRVSVVKNGSYVSSPSSHQTTLSDSPQHQHSEIWSCLCVSRLLFCELSEKVCHSP